MCKLLILTPRPPACDNKPGKIQARYKIETVPELPVSQTFPATGFRLIAPEGRVDANVTVESPVRILAGHL